MIGTKRLCVGVAIVICVAIPAHAQHHGVQTVYWRGGHGHGHGVAGGGFTRLNGLQGSFYMGMGVGGWYAYPTFFIMAPGGFFSPFGVMPPAPMPVRGPLLPPPPPGLLAPAANPKIQPADTARAKQFVTRGDRLFRAGNSKKAEERYLQAIRIAPDEAAPHLRLALIAVVRGNYTEAAMRLREAETAQPGWIVTAPDIEAIFGEPAEFSRHVARLETYIQSHPDDRDAWLVLGAEWFLSGRTAKAADVFQRLNDPRRKPDTALSAFLDASNQAAIKPRNAPE